MATFDAFDLSEVLPSGPLPSWIMSDPVCDQYILDTPRWSTVIHDDPYGVKMLMAYPDSLAPLLSPQQLVRIWMDHRITYPNFLTSLPMSRQRELLKIFYDETANKTKSARRGEDPPLDEVLSRMSDTYKEAFMHLLPKGETLEARVMLWLMA